jgi:hypothetical protein
MLIPTILAFERTMPLFLFALYLLTAFRVTRYGTWLAAGAPNPFLPRKLKVAVAGYEKRLRRAI